MKHKRASLNKTLEYKFNVNLLRLCELLFHQSQERTRIKLILFYHKTISYSYDVYYY
jgi:hypothetical protein